MNQDRICLGFVALSSLSSFNKAYSVDWHYFSLHVQTIGIYVERRYSVEFVGNLMIV